VTPLLSDPDLGEWYVRADLENIATGQPAVQSYNHDPVHFEDLGNGRSRIHRGPKGVPFAVDAVGEMRTEIEMLRDRAQVTADELAALRRSRAVRLGNTMLARLRSAVEDLRYQRQTFGRCGRAQCTVESDESGEAIESPANDEGRSQLHGVVGAERMTSHSVDGSADDILSNVDDDERRSGQVVTGHIGSELCTQYACICHADLAESMLAPDGGRHFDLGEHRDHDRTIELPYGLVIRLDDVQLHERRTIGEDRQRPSLTRSARAVPPLTRRDAASTAAREGRRLTVRAGAASRPAICSLSRTRSASVPALAGSVAASSTKVTNSFIDRPLLLAARLTRSTRRSSALHDIWAMHA
jgi:hypothetical protein